MDDAAVVLATAVPDGSRNFLAGETGRLAIQEHDVDRRVVSVWRRFAPDTVGAVTVVCRPDRARIAWALSSSATRTGGRSADGCHSPFVVVISKRAPPARLSVMATPQPWASAIWRTIVSPNPVP